MWVLDPANSRELLDRLRPHSLSSDFEVVWCGEGWRALVGDCHDDLAAAFPDYRFYAIKQEWGVLAFQARPRAGEMTAEELARVHEITDSYGQASEVVCEWCGRPGSLRADRPEWLTLCDRCAQDLETTKYPRLRPIV
ncbi:hypothetical protein GCM10009744_33000 [Kribbella alba]|uniref:Zinc ribbon domain-containing protein n=1 Tax=Kribbella alba TaxID=190197 RepID=A0ABN2FCG1_9ACTN